MVNNTLNNHIILHKEDAYAAGAGAVAYAETALTDMTGSVNLDQPKDTLSFPFQSMEKERITTLNMSANEIAVEPFAATYEEGNFPLYCQDDYLLKESMSGTMGLSAPSYTVQWRDPAGAFESYGTQIIDYEMNFKSNAWNEQKISSQCYSTSKLAGNGAADAEFLAVTGATRPIAWYQTDVTVDGSDLDVKDGTLRIKNKWYTDTTYVNGTYRKAPVLDSKAWEVDLTFQADPDDFLVDIMAEAVDPMNMSIELQWGDGTKTLELSGMYVDPKSAKMTEVPSPDGDRFYEYTATWKHGSGFAYNYA